MDPSVQDASVDHEAPAGAVLSARNDEQWPPSDDSLEEQVRTTVQRHLATYRNDLVRLRSDINQEEMILETGYRRRQVIELIQNGADALLGTRGGRLEVHLDGDCLIVANQGRPLDAGGIQALLYSNISEKRGNEIGRLGVGFKSVLELSSRPFILSRSVSLSFSHLRARALLEAELGGTHPDVPVMRFAEPVDPRYVATELPAVGPFLEWATTVVVLPLDKDKEWVDDLLDPTSFPKEFLAFSPHVASVTFNNHRTGSNRSITLSNDGPILIVEESDDTESAWRLKTRRVTLSEAARHDGGTRFQRDEVEIAWAIPADDGRDRAVWAFFPVPSVSTPLPGILNTAWKLSEDRSNVVQGPFNEYLIDQAAQLVVDCVRSEVPETNLGRALEMLPPTPPQASASTSRRAEGTGWFHDRLQRSVWELARSAALVPAIDGSWHRGVGMNLWPTWINKAGMGPIADLWSKHVDLPSRWVHRTVMTDVRHPRAAWLGALNPGVHTWIQAVRNSEDPVGSSRAALEIVQMVRSAEAASESHAALLDAEVVWTEAEEWTSIAKCRFDDNAPPSTFPARRLRLVVKAIHRDAGISPDFGERSLLELAEEAADAPLLGA